MIDDRVRLSALSAARPYCTLPAIFSRKTLSVYS